MPLSKIQAESMNLADTYAFTGTVSGASQMVKISTTTASNAANVSFTGLDTTSNNFFPDIQIFPALFIFAGNEEYMEDSKSVDDIKTLSSLASKYIWDKTNIVDLVSTIPTQKKMCFKNSDLSTEKFITNSII